MKFRRIIAAFMAAAIVCGSTAAAAGAEEAKALTAEKYYGISVKSEGKPSDDEAGVVYHGILYARFDMELEMHGPDVYGYDYGQYKEFTVPAEIDGMPVVSIKSLDALENLEKIFIPSTIQWIALAWIRDQSEIFGFRYSSMFEECPKITDVYFEGTEEQWYNIQNNSMVKNTWDGKFSKDSNFAYNGIEKITLHVNCKDINDEGTIIKFDSSSPTKEAAKPAKVSGIKKSFSKTVVKLSWNESKGAESYVIKYSTDKKTWKTKTVSTNSVKLSKLKTGTKYYFKIAAKNSDGTSAYSKVFSVTTKK